MYAVYMGCTIVCSMYNAISFPGNAVAGSTRVYLYIANNFRKLPSPENSFIFVPVPLQYLMNSKTKQQ